MISGSRDCNISSAIKHDSSALAPCAPVLLVSQIFPGSHVIGIRPSTPALVV